MTETILLLFFGFAVKHFLCDFVLQTKYMIREKGLYGVAGGVHHACLHSLGTWVVLFPFTGLFTAVIMATVDGIVHYHIDWAKIKLSSRWTSQDWAYWVWFGIDQLAHYLTYIAIIAWAIN